MLSFMPYVVRHVANICKVMYGSYSSLVLCALIVVVSGILGVSESSGHEPGSKDLQNKQGIDGGLSDA